MVEDTLGRFCFLGTHVPTQGGAVSNPALRNRIVTQLALEHEGWVRADSVSALQRTLGMEDVTRTQFWSAVRSLAFKPGCQKIYLGRPYGLDGSRGVKIALLAHTAR